MLYRIGTRSELPRVEGRLPEQVMTELFQGVMILDVEYGEERDYLQSGGYSLIAETENDVVQLRQILDVDTRPCEWATRIGRDTGYLSALYLLNDDFAIMVYMPISIAPGAILNDLED